MQWGKVDKWPPAYNLCPDCLLIISPANKLRQELFKNCLIVVRELARSALAQRVFIKRPDLLKSCFLL
jgi:hypothetical protein